MKNGYNNFRIYFRFMNTNSKFSAAKNSNSKNISKQSDATKTAPKANYPALIKKGGTLTIYLPGLKNKFTHKIVHLKPLIFEDLKGLTPYKKMQTIAHPYGFTFKIN